NRDGSFDGTILITDSNDNTKQCYQSTDECEEYRLKMVEVTCYQLIQVFSDGSYMVVANFGCGGDSGSSPTSPSGSNAPSGSAGAPPVPEPAPIVNDDALKQNTLTNCIYIKLQNSKLLENMLKEFVNSTVYNCTWRIVPSIAGYNGEQAYGNITDSNGSVIIDINSYYFGKVAPLAIAKTMLHESIHANLYQKLATILGKENLSNKNFEELYRSYQETTIGTPQHDFMSKYYIPSLASALQSFDGNSLPSDYYVSLAWTGLENTSAYNNLTQSQKDEIERKINEINSGSKICH
ncbi:MAG: hypothetical protein WAO52_01750, partial [Prolixibacteraceae bacterium]